MMTAPVVEPRRARADIRFLWPDLHRPGLAMRCPVPAGQAWSLEAAAVCERVERELAAEAWRYRRLLVAGVAILGSPLLMLGVAWAGVRFLPPQLGFEPFFRGAYGLPLSLYEAASFLCLVALLVFAHARVGDSWRSMCRLGADYRHLRDAEDPVRARIAEEAASGRWPRVCALLRTARVFGEYRPLIDPCDLQ